MIATVETKPKFLTVAELKKFIADIEAAHGVGCIDDHAIHFLNLTRFPTDEGEWTRYATMVDCDSFDCHEGDETKPIKVLSFCHWPDVREDMDDLHKFLTARKANAEVK